MLIRFEVCNYRSILGPAELSMVAVDQDRAAARRADLLGQSLLAVAAIFGPNASGKSNVIAALAWLRDAVQYSLRTWDHEIPIEPFAFGDGPTQPSGFAVESLINGVRFEYVLELDSAAVRYEGLFHYPEKKRRRIFERDGADLKLQRGLGGLSGTRELLTNQTLALSVAHRFDEPLVSGFVRDLTRTQTFGLPRRPRLSRAGGPHWLSSRSTIRWFEDPPPTDPAERSGVADARPVDRSQALALLKMADLGIVDVLIDEEEVRYPAPADSGFVRAQKRVRLVHEAEQEQVPLDFYAESEGTRTWFQLIGPVLFALRSGGLLLFDELDASLHPTLSAQLIRLFQDPVTNPRGAQLIFTSHDTSLFNHLNRDEVWLTEKTRSGTTRLGALAEFAGERVRRSRNLETAYLHGRFGALPDVDQTGLLRALGLIG
ncbi:AAA family ATPase [Parafrankia elaeagni]|uniref:AAA family ATPase n=1 Tax=Parafrankia elaeagni TaxID=222534 RepID=UPI000361C647|nr:ATP-binding protein [Parafrankia elaeagni]